eukprot:scaffold305281_cov22-Tisochrysis_lutea.AAC.1
MTPMTNSIPLRALSSNYSCHLPHLAQTRSAKLRTGKSGHTQMAAAIYLWKTSHRSRSLPP